MKNKICIDKSHFIATIINIINVRSKLVYIKHLFVLDTGEGSQGLTRTSCPACTQVVDRECPLYGCCQVMIWKPCPLTIVGGVLGECHTPCKSKITFVDLDKE